MEMMMDAQTEIFNPLTEPNVLTGLGNLVDSITKSTLKASMDRADKSFAEFRDRVQKQVNETLSQREILHIKVQNKPEVELTFRASKILPRLIINANLDIYTLMVGPAGCGKTTAANQLAETLVLPFYSVCLTSGASETWLFGRQTPTGFVEGPFSKAYRDGGVFLADEIDAADANLLLSINTALSHNVMLNPMNGEYITKHKEFIFIAAANTNGKGADHMYTGRSRLDAATLDRFVILNVEYDQDLEAQICKEGFIYEFLMKTRTALKEDGYDEFISTRAFRNCYVQYEAGVSFSSIKDSLISNWGDSAKKLAEKNYSGTNKPSNTKKDNPFLNNIKKKYRKANLRWDL